MVLVGFYFLKISSYGNINIRKSMVESDNFSADWSQLLDDMPHEPGVVVSPRTQTATAGATNSGDMPISSNFASTNKKNSSFSGGSSASSGSSNNNNKKRFPWWMLLLLLLVFGGSASAATGFNPVYRALKVVGIEGRDGKDGSNGLDGIDGQDGKLVKQTTVIGSNSSASGSGNGTDGADGASGQDGSDGQNGADGADGVDGADGADGTNACISGLCVSRQVGSPGTQETGNINIDGDVLASQIGINDTTPSNTLTVNGTMDVSGHSAFGGVAVDGGTMVLDTLNSTSEHQALVTVGGTLTDISTTTGQYNGIFGVIALDPDAPTSFLQVNGVIGGVEISSGNAENFAGNINGINGVVSHAGSGTVSSAIGANYVISNHGGGTITNGTGLNIIPINLSGAITNYKGINIATPVNAGTVTNNYGLYINDQETGVGCTNCYNIYSAGATAKNYFAGLVGIGTAPTTSRLAFESSTASTGGLDFGADTLLYRTAAGSLKIEQVGGTNARLYFGNTGVTQHYIGDINGDMIAFSGGNNFLVSGNSGTALSVFAGNGASSTPAATISALGATQPGLAVKGAASQSANLQEWQNSSSTVLSAIDENGYLGIGTSDPQYELHISQNATWTSSLAITHTTPGKTLNLSTTGGATNSWNIENASGLLYFYNTSLSETSLELQDNGNVGIGTNFSSAGAKLHVKEDSDTTVLRLQDTTGTCDLNPDSGSLGTSCSSDERLKTDITDAASVLSEINGLKIHDYTVIASGKQTTGLIAQELLNTNPDMVHLGEDGYYKVDSYNPWKVLKGIQELSASVDDVQSTFTTALEQTNGDLDQANQTLADLGLRVDDLSTTLQSYADQLADHDQRIQSLEAKVQALEQAN